MILNYFEVLSWPVVALIALFLIRPIISQIISGSKIKVSLGGVSIETTLPEIREIISEQIGGSLSQSEQSLLKELATGKEIHYKDGNSSSDRKFLRPLRNAGLIMTIPRNAYLADATSIQLTALGRLYVRAIDSDA